MSWRKHIRKGKVLDYPIFQLMLTSIKNSEGTISVKSKPIEGTEGPVDPLISIEGTPANYSIKVIAERELVLNNLTAAMCRSGIVKPYGLEDVALELTKNEDLILGLDTNVIYNCIITEHLLGAMDLVNPYSYSKMPNWMLIVIPGVVMKEIENAANHKIKGRLTHIGRSGFRALQEVMVLKESRGTSSISVQVAGKTNPQQLRYSDEDGTKLENADSLIRDQFRSFVKEFDIRKGVFFLTMDKTNSSLGKAEGLNAIRVKHPKMLRNGYDLRQPKGETILLSRILYELAVEFGVIEISWTENGRLHYIELDSCWQWKNMGHWENWQLLCSGYDNQFFKKVNGFEPLRVEEINTAWNELRDAMI